MAAIAYISHLPLAAVHLHICQREQLIMEYGLLQLMVVPALPQDGGYKLSLERMIYIPYKMHFHKPIVNILSWQLTQQAHMFSYTTRMMEQEECNGY